MVQSNPMYDFVIFTDVTDTVLAYKAIGAYKCAYILRENGYTVLVVDHLHTFNQEEFQKVIDKSVGTNTKFVGFSSTFFNSVGKSFEDDTTSTEFSWMVTLDSHIFPQGKEFENHAIKYIKQVNPECKILAGGVKAHKDVNNRNVDYAILGYGETACLNLANHLSNSEELKYGARKNLWGVTVIDNALAPDYVFGETDFRWEESDVIGHKVLPLEISRGCIFKCRFCSYPLIGKKENDHIRSAESLRQELQDNYDRFGVEYYYVLDDTFNDNEAKLDNILEAVKKLTFQPKFWAYVRIDLLTARKDIDKLYDIGIRSMFLGIETIHPKAAQAISKGGKKSNHIDMIRAVREKYGNKINMHGSFIIGLPDETLDDVDSTFDRLMSEDIPLHTFRWAGLVLQRPSSVVWSSEFGRDHEKWGYQVTQEQEDDMLGMQWTNQLMTRKQAWEKATQFNNSMQLSDRYHIPGQVLWALINYGYDLNELSNMQYNQLEWNHIEHVKKKEFMDNYKQKLFDYLDTKAV